MTKRDRISYIELTSDLIITNYNPKTDDILNYKGSHSIEILDGTPLSLYYEISLDLHKEYCELKRRAEE